MKRIVMTSYKGGVGKTLISFNFAGYLYSKGHRVLVIDLDGQSNMTRNMLPQSKKRSTVFEYNAIDFYNSSPMSERCLPENLIYKNPLEKYEGFDLIPSHKKLKDYEDAYPQKFRMGPNLALSNWMKVHAQYLKDNYEFIIVDSAPNLSIGTYTTLTVADEIYLITDVSGNSLDGALEIKDRWAAECAQTNMQNNMFLTFANNVDTRTGAGQGMIELLSATRGNSPDDFCKNFIKYSSKIKESEYSGPLLLQMTPSLMKNPGVVSLIELFDEIYERRNLGGN